MFRKISRSSVFLLVSRGGCGTTWGVVLHCRVLQIAFCRVNNMHRRRIRRGNGRGTWACLKPHICSWWSSRSLWPCRCETGSQWSSSREAPGAPCKLSWKRTEKRQCGSRWWRIEKLPGSDITPDVRHCIPVLVVCRPDGYFISFCTDVDHGSAHVVAVVVEGLADQTQELQNSSSSDGKWTDTGASAHESWSELS